LTAGWVGTWGTARAVSLKEISRYPQRFFSVSPSGGGGAGLRGLIAGITGELNKKKTKVAETVVVVD